jgi:hypothetical protein
VITIGELEKLQVEHEKLRKAYIDLCHELATMRREDKMTEKQKSLMKLLDSKNGLGCDI